MMKKLFLIISVIIFASSVSFSQFGMEEDLLKAKGYSSFDKVYGGSEFKIALEVVVDSGWHINSHKPYDEYLIPSELSVTNPDENFILINAAYPEPKDYKLSFSEEPLSVWEGQIFLGGLVKAKEELAPGIYNLVINLDYQACNDMSCLAPTSVSDTIQIELADKQSVVNQINQEIFDQIELEFSPAAETIDEEEDDFISSTLEKNGILIGLIAVFIGGLALNLTPCVYPLIPITIGYFGGQSEGKTSRLVMMGVLFVLGMAVTYSVVGVVTSLSGAVFGSLLQNPVVIIFIAVIFLVLSLSMFGVYEFKVPDKLVAKAGGAKGGFYGAFFMGLTMGIVAAPCIGPFVLGLVTYVAAKGDPYFGFLMFFVLAIGLGTPYLFLAIFSGKIKSLPRAGEWMEAVKHIFGWILIGMALYFILPLLPKGISGYLLPVFGIIAAVYLIFFDKMANKIKAFKIFKIAFSVVVIAVSIYALLPSDTNSIDWKPYSESSIAEVKANRGIIIDFYADWCIPCKELDALTFSDPEVIALSEEFSTYKADLTKSLSEDVEKLREKYNIVGVPTVLILDSEGNVKERITGFVNAQEFYKILSSVN